MTVEQRKISQLPDVGTISGEEYFHIAFNGRSYKVTMNALVAHFTQGVDMSVVDNIRELIRDLPDVSGLVTTEQLEQNLELIRNAIPSLQGFATTEQVAAAITHAIGQIPQSEVQDLSGLATKEELREAIGSIQFPEIPEIPEIPDVSEFATRAEVQQAVAAIEIPQLPNMNDFATKQDLQHAISQIPSGPGEAPAVDLSEYAKTADVQEHVAEVVEQAVSLIQIPSIEGLATHSEVDEKISVALQNTSVDLSGYATKEEVQAVQEAVSSITIPSIEGLATEERVIALINAIPPADTSAISAVGDRVEEVAAELESFAKKSEVTLAVEAMSAEILEAKEEFKSLSETTIDRILWVGPNSTGEEHGSMNRPFTTIQAAIDSTPENGQQYVILCVPGTTSVQNVLFTGRRQSYLIQGFGCHDSHLVQIKGNVTVSGANATRFRLKDISIQATGDVPGLVFDSSAGRHYLHNVTIEKGTGHTGPLVEFKGTEARWTVFTQSCINGDIVARDTVAAGHIIYLNMNNGTSHIHIEGNTDISATGGFMGSISALGGNGAINSVTFTGNEAGEGIVNAGSGVYRARFSNFEKVDGTFLTNSGVHTKLCNDE